MSLLHQLKTEAAELDRLIDASVVSQKYPEFQVTEERVEMYRLRRGRIQQMIDTIEQPTDHGGWEDR